jgi:hypothetical protein
MVLSRGAVQLVARSAGSFRSLVLGAARSCRVDLAVGAACRQAAPALQVWARGET